MPLKTWSPTAFSTGVASPVSADSSLALLPVTTMPSAGNASPGLTRTRWSSCSSSTATSLSLPSGSTNVARFGARLQQRADLALRAIERVLLHRAGRGKEKQQQHRLAPGADEHRADRDREHQKMNVDLALLQIFPRIDRRVPATGDQADEKKTLGSHGRPGAKCPAITPAIPAVPQIAASTERVRHS